MRKYLAPFFAEQHGFLMGRWWFRLAIVAYVIAFLALPFYLYGIGIEPYLKCYDTTVALFKYGTSIFEQEMAHCQESVANVLPTVIGFAIVTTVVLHYLFQLIFFKLVMNFIILGGNKRPTSG